MGGQQLLEPSKLQNKEKTQSHEFNKQKEQDFKRVLEQVVEQEFKAKESIQQATSGSGRRDKLLGSNQRSAMDRGRKVLSVMEKFATGPRQIQGERPTLK